MSASVSFPGAEDGHVEQALPWYANGTLPDVEMERIEQHLAACERCRACAALEVQLLKQVRERKGAVDLAPQFAWNRLAAQLDAGPQEAGASERGPAVNDSAWKRGTVARRAISTVLVAQAAAIAVLGVAVLQLSNWNTARYTTLTDAAPLAAPAGARLRLVVAPQTSNQRFRSMLETIGGVIRSGPGARGIYTIEIPASAAGGSALANRDAALGWLRAQPDVQLAEPVGAGQGP